ncbi:MAG: 30S ribosomal protein S20, partial [Clostridia bacterium]|nr:30S ribosomal protein S20 [Clostridia bacterium]
MPNIKSAKKRVLVNQKKTEQNKNIRSEVRTEIKKIEALIKENKFEEAKTLLPHAF